MPRKIVFVTVMAALFLLGCDGGNAGEPFITIDDYDTSCSVDVDCVKIHLGGVCDCECDSGAINKSDEEKYFADRGNPDCDVMCGPCGPIEAYCGAGTCAIRMMGLDADTGK